MRAEVSEADIHLFRMLIENSSQLIDLTESGCCENIERIGLQKLDHLILAVIFGPTDRRRMKIGITNGGVRSMLDQQLRHLHMAMQRRFMQRRSAGHGIDVKIQRQHETNGAQIIFASSLVQHVGMSLPHRLINIEFLAILFMCSTTIAGSAASFLAPC